VHPATPKPAAPTPKAAPALKAKEPLVTPETLGKGAPISGSTSFSKREAAAEELYVRKHEAELKEQAKKK
jgi:Mitochondrial ATPase inhibitor, IATP